MKKSLPPYVYPKGKRGYLYFERKGKTVRLPDIASPDFWAAYALAKKDAPRLPARRNFNGLIASYERSDRFAKLKPRTKADYDKITRYISEKMGAGDPAKMQRKHVIEAQMVNRDTVRFANYIVQVLSVLFEHAIDIGWIKENPAKGVRLIQSTAEPRKPWPTDLIDAYRATATGRALLVFELCLGTGQRIGDVLKMQWGDISEGGINVSQGKTGKALWIPMPPELRDVLADTPKAGLFIVAHQGRAVSYRAAHDAVMKVRKAIGAVDYDLHALRHTTASQLAANGFDNETIMAITGHTTTASVERYTATTRQKARALKTQKPD